MNLSSASMASAQADHLENSSKLAIAFQPIVDVSLDCEVFAHEALLRGDMQFEGVCKGERYAFDAVCRQQAIEIAHLLDLPARLSLNVTPGAIADSHFGLHASIRAARRAGFPEHRLIFEVTENERIVSPRSLRRWLDVCRNRGILIAIDDFGAGYNGLNTLVELEPDIVKIDMALIRRIDSDLSRQAVVKGVAETAARLRSIVIAEGVETQEELRTLHDMGIDLMQGFLFAKPTVNRLPEFSRHETLLHGSSLGR